MQLPQPTWLHVAIPVLPVGEMPAIEEGRACEAELHGGLDLACRIHAGVPDEGREVLTCGLKQGAVLGARYLRDDALLDRPRGGRREVDVAVSVHVVAEDAHPPHEGVNVQLVAHALSAPVVGWQRRRRPGVHDLGQRRGRCKLVGEAGIGLLFPAIVISVAALRILPLPRGDGSNRGTYERQQHEWPHGTSRVVLCSVCGTPYWLLRRLNVYAAVVRPPDSCVTSSQPCSPRAFITRMWDEACGIVR